jgi:hypothetical protein
LNHWIQEGIECLKRGDRIQAERALRIAVQEAPREVEGWLWLSKVVKSDAERVTALLRVLELDPHSATARQTLELLQNRQGDENLPHVNPFSLDGEQAGPSSPETREQPFAASEVMEEKPGPTGESTNRLAIWTAVVVLVLIAVVILVLVTLPRF